jgi:ferredoxin
MFCSCHFLTSFFNVQWFISLSIDLGINAINYIIISVNMSQEPIENQITGELKAAKDAKVIKIGKIIVDRNLCIGAGSCVAVAPGVFELDSENKAVVYNPKGADDETILLAAKSCPTQAILVFDEEGNQIYP